VTSAKNQASFDQFAESGFQKEEDLRLGYGWKNSSKVIIIHVHFLTAELQILQKYSISCIQAVTNE
jgi:hypothetical protein